MNRIARRVALMGMVGAIAGAAAAAARREVDDAWWTTPAQPPASLLRAVLGPNADAEWDITGGAPAKDGGPFSLAASSDLDRPVLVCGPVGATLQGRTAYGSVEVSCRVRLAPTPAKPSAVFALTVGRDPTNSASPGRTVSLSGTYDGDIAITTPGASPRYDLRAYDTIMPTWDDAMRIPIEQDMATLPRAQDKWVSLRWQIAPGWGRVWVDDRLVATRTSSNAPLRPGLLSMRLDPGTQLAEFHVRPLPGDQLRTDPSFEPISLDGYVRDRALANGVAVAPDALPFGREVQVGGVPFRFATREAGRPTPDHLDLSRSLYRQANAEGYQPAYVHRFSGSFVVDPARITLRIPNGRYDALHVIAAFDGEKDRIPLMSAVFFRPDAGFVQFFQADVPGLSDSPRGGAVPLPVKLESGRSANLWLVTIPLDPARLASFSDMDFIELELTKQMKLFRSYPDPISYGWHQAGPPSGVHVYALTLHRPDVELSVAPKRFGDSWTDPEVPTYIVSLSNRTARTRPVELALQTLSHDGQSSTRVVRAVSATPGQLLRIEIPCPVKRNGSHELRVTLTDTGRVWTETRYFARLAPDTRAANWSEGQGPMFSYWSYFGGHYTPPEADIRDVMARAGARSAPGGRGNAWPITPQWGWAGEEPLDRARYDAYKTNAVELIRAKQGDSPNFVTFFPEPHISRDLTAGNPPDYWGDPPYAPNAEEQKALRVHFNTARAAAEGVRAAWPQSRILIPWGDPLYVIPLLRAGFPTSLLDGSGLDMIGFERLPEQQIAQQSTHRLYFLREEYRKAGVTNPLLWYVEGTFVPTEPGACTWDEQAERFHRWTLLSLAYGCDRYYSGWFAYDCGSYYGAEHYGGCGIQRRLPYADPKPAYAHFATMTRMLERTRFDRWLPTGSRSVYALRFDRLAGGSVYALWTVRGRRPAQLALETNGVVTVTDSMDNGAPVRSTNGTADVTLTPSPIYVTGPLVTSIALGPPDHRGCVEEARGREQQTWHTGPGFAPPPPVARTTILSTMGDGSWSIPGARDADYENNNYDVRRYPGRMIARTELRTDFPEIEQRPRGALAVHLEAQQERERPFMPWYSVLTPARPIEIPGKASALGLWVRAASDWGRVVYCLRDAKGERWISIGTKDDWNCNDPHNWSVFNFDGWRYLRFEMPAHSGYDRFRESGTTWWGHRGGDGIVDLPLSIESVIVERRTHVMYVNTPEPADPADVLLADLTAEYASASDATPEAIRVSRLRMPLPKTARTLPNPIERMLATNALPAAAIDSVRQPDWGYDGTSCHVFFREQPGAAQYQVWVAAYPDGRGAVALGAMPASGGLVRGLRPARKLYLWLTYTEKPEAGAKTGRQSKPSAPFEIELVDAFGMK